MRNQDFLELTLLIAMHVRNEMEDFHVEHLSDSQMKELNRLIRQAIFDIVSATNQKPKTKKEKQQVDKTIQWLIMMIPDYWEIPQDSTVLESLSSTAKKNSAKGRNR